MTFSLDGEVELGIGGGVVADSVPDEEWSESLLKSEFVTKRRPPFELLETMIWRRSHGDFNAPDSNGIDFLDEHLERLSRSADYFAFKCDIAKISAELAGFVQSLPEHLQFARMRLLLSSDGTTSLSFVPLESRGWGRKTLKLAISADRVDSRDLFLRHKTTNRAFFDEQYAKAVFNGFDEVVFLNERGEITEGAISNVFILKEGAWLTPSLDCGLLPGVFRAKLITDLNAEETRLTLDDLLSAQKLLICNSVRGAAECRPPES